MFNLNKIMFCVIVYSQQNIFANQDISEPTILKINWWDSSGKIIAVSLSFMTLLTMLIGYIKKIISATNFEPRLVALEKEVTDIKNKIEKNYNDIKELIHLLRIDIQNKVNVSNYNELVQEHESLEENFSSEIIKIYKKLEDLSLIELELSKLKKEIENSNLSKKEEIKEINENIKNLRENIREDINEIKQTIMNLLISLKVSYKN